MSVSNKTIREFEEAAVEAVQAMNGAAELLEAAGMSRVAQLLRLRAVELELAESACARERALTMSEEEMREEFAVLGLDWDEASARGHRLLHRLLADHRHERAEANRIFAIQPGEIADLVRSQYDQAFGSEAAALAPQVTGVVYPVGEPPELGRTHSTGLGDGGESEMDRWQEQLDGHREQTGKASNALRKALDSVLVPRPEQVPAIVTRFDSADIAAAEARLRGRSRAGDGAAKGSRARVDWVLPGRGPGTRGR
jgi:hypothetical protein